MAFDMSEVQQYGPKLNYGVSNGAIDIVVILNGGVGEDNGCCGMLGDAGNNTFTIAVHSDWDRVGGSSGRVHAEVVVEEHQSCQNAKYFGLPEYVSSLWPWTMPLPCQRVSLAQNVHAQQLFLAASMLALLQTRMMCFLAWMAVMRASRCVRGWILCHSMSAHCIGTIERDSRRSFGGSV